MYVVIMLTLVREKTTEQNMASVVVVSAVRTTMTR